MPPNKVNVILQSISTGVVVKSKTQQWQNICDAVSAVLAEEHAVTEIKINGLTLKWKQKHAFPKPSTQGGKKCISQAMMITGGGWGKVLVSEVDQRMKEIIGEVALTGVQ